MQPDDLRTVLEGVGTVIGAVSFAWFSKRRGEKVEAAADQPRAGIVAASIISDRAVAELGKTIRETSEQRHDDTRKLRDAMGDLGDAMGALERAIERGLPPAAGIDIAAVLARLDRIEGVKR